MMTEVPFESLYAHGFVRVACAVPRVRLADPTANAGHIIELGTRAAAAGALVVVFPELSLSAYSNDDLFQQRALTDATLAALERITEASRDIAALLVVGAPLVAEQRLFNTAVMIQGGRILGVAPKSYLPNYREFYEKRQFAAARDAVDTTIDIAGARVPFGNRLLFTSTSVPDLVLHAEVCEDLWVPIPPSTYAALGGATLLANLSASNITVGKADYRRLLCRSQSARTVSAYLYSAADDGESTTDLAWDGHAMVYENGDLIAESERFAGGDRMITADIDLGRLAADRVRLTSSIDNGTDHAIELERIRRVRFDLRPPAAPVRLQRCIERFPYVPSDPSSRAERCEEVYRIQVDGLLTRLRATGIEKLVVGVSGGLDSTQALIVAARTMDRLGLPRGNVLAYTMPGFATSTATRGAALRLMAALGVTAGEIDIRPSATQMLHDIGHPAAAGVPDYDRTYENVQAGERTSHLFRLANHHGALVVGTGDLSELALGWSTYGVGDQMAHYNVNASVPKTLIQFLLRWLADSDELGEETSAVLRSVLDTEISPELIPGDGADGAPQTLQRSEEVVGPFELQDFYLYWTLRFGYVPSKVAFLAHQAWGDRTGGTWPDLIPVERRHEYPLSAIKHWLRVFLQRFFETSQFKRSAMPNAPKVGSGGSLSPRGDWRAPSDGSAAVWLDELERVPG